MRKFLLIVSLLGSLGAAGVAVAQSASEKESASRGAQDGCVGAAHMTSEQHPMRQPMHDTMTTQQRHAKMVQHLQHGGTEKGPLSESMMGSMRGHHPDMMRGMH